MRAINHPAKGSTIKVEPIRTLEDIDKIRRLLKNKPRDLCLFNLGINTNLRASDLTNIKVDQVRDLKPGGSFELKERKTQKLRRITVNGKVTESVARLLKTNYSDGGFLFPSRKCHGKPITVVYVNMLMKKWCKFIGLKGNYGSHTLRKTFGYVHHHYFQTPIPRLMLMYNHANQRQTLDYLCIQDAEIEADYLREI